MSLEETAEQKFIRIAKYRINKVLDGYRLLANLKSANYKSSREQRNEILSAIRQGLDELEAHWAGEKLDKSAFKFSCENESNDNKLFDG